MTDATPVTPTQPDKADEPRRFWKSTIVIYSPYDPTEVELIDLAQDATDGECICGAGNVVELSPGDDPAFPWEFFQIPDDDEDVEDPNEEDA